MAASGDLRNIYAALPEAFGALIEIAPVGTALPTEVGDTIDPAFTPFSILDEGGLTITPVRSVTEERDEAGRVVKTIVTEKSVDLGFAFREFLNSAALETVYGPDNVTITAATATSGEKVAVAWDGEIPPAFSAICRTKDGDAKVWFVIPNVQITEEGEIVLNSSQSIKPPVSAKGLPDGAGKSFYVYTDDGKFSV